MEVSFIDVFLSVFSLVLLAVPGYIFAKCRMLPEKAAEAFSVLVLYGCQSALVLTGFQSPYNGEILINILIVCGLSLAAHLIMAGLVFAFTAKREAEARLRCLRYASVFSNCGFMGLPFLQSVFAESLALGEILIYGAVVVAVFNILNWTLGVFIMTGDRKSISIKKIVFNPVIISVIIGFLLFAVLKTPVADIAAEGSFTDKLLTKIMECLDFLSNMVTPLSMTVIGINLAGINARELFANKFAYISCLLKLVLMPLVTVAISVFLPIEQEIKYVMFFLLAMPSATSTALFAVRFGGDGNTASSAVLLSTVFSVITVPLLYLLFGLVV